MMREDFGTYFHIETADDFLIKEGVGALISVIINSAVAEDVIIVYDGEDDTGDVIATITLPATLTGSQLTLPYWAKFSVGLYVETSGTSDITVVYT